MADLGSDTSLVIALNEIEKKVVQAEKDRNNLETNLGNKGVNFTPGSKMSSLIDKVGEIESLDGATKKQTILYIINKMSVNGEINASGDEYFDYYIKDSYLYLVMQDSFLVSGSNYYKAYLIKYNMNSNTIEQNIELVKQGSKYIGGSYFYDNYLLLFGNSYRLYQYSLDDFSIIKTIHQSSTLSYTGGTKLVRVDNYLYAFANGYSTSKTSVIQKINLNTYEIDKTISFIDRYNKLYRVNYMFYDKTSNLLIACADYNNTGTIAKYDLDLNVINNSGESSFFSGREAYVYDNVLYVINGTGYIRTFNLYDYSSILSEDILKKINTAYINTASVCVSVDVQNEKIFYKNGSSLFNVSLPYNLEYEKISLYSIPYGSSMFYISDGILTCYDNQTILNYKIKNI